MAKIDLDKYYTRTELSKRLVKLTLDLLGNLVTDVIEPAAGNGSFSNLIDGCIAYDISPEADNIIKADFLKTPLNYKQGRLFIGNVPFGKSCSLANRFLKKCMTEGDFVASILPVVYLNRDNIDGFSLIYSEDLGSDEVFSGRKVHCCYNVYARNLRHICAKKILNGLQFREYRSDNLSNFKFDYAYNCFGNNLGRRPDTDSKFKYSMRMKINYKDDLKAEIINFMETFDWEGYLQSRSIVSGRLPIYAVKDALMDHFGDELKISYKNTKTLFDK